MSQEELEKRTGINRAYISKIETGGLPNVTINTLLKILGAMGKTIAVVPKGSPHRLRVK
jgi:transcriptional regulator with XRE-family HTH domain